MRHDFKEFYVCNSFLNFTNNDNVRTFNECNMIKSHSTLLKTRRVKYIYCQNKHFNIYYEHI